MLMTTFTMQELLLMKIQEHTIPMSSHGGAHLEVVALQELHLLELFAQVTTLVLTRSKVRPLIPDL